MSRRRETRVLDLLESLFGADDPDLIRDLQAELETVTLKAGETLFRQHDLPDAAYLILSGRLRVVLESDGSEERVLNEVGRGELVGEMALLTDDPRSATVFAIRDTELARLTPETFFRILQRSPRFHSHLTSTIVRRLRRQSSADSPGASPLSSIALVPTHPSVALEELAAQIAEALTVFGTVVQLGKADVQHALGPEPPSSSRLARWLQDQEESARFTLYRADSTWSPWTELCARQADRVLLVGMADGPAQPEEIEHRLVNRWSKGRSPRRSLVIVSDSPSPRETERWLAPRDVEDHFHLRRDVAGDTQRLARFLAGEAVGVVLGGGGASGLAHIGVIRALQELGIPIDAIGGTSIGAAIGGMFARSESWREVLESWRSGFRPVRDYTWPAVALTSGRKLNQSIFGVLGETRIEDLRTSYFALSTNLNRAEPVVSTSGGLAAAVRASVSLPGIFPPCLMDGKDYLVDGALLNNVPVDVMRSLVGSGPIIAVDVSEVSDLAADERISSQASGWKLLWNRLNPFAARSPAPSMVGLLLRSTLVGSLAARNRNRDLADLYLELPLGRFGLLEFDAVDAIVQQGYESSLEPLREWWQGRD